MDTRRTTRAGAGVLAGPRRPPTWLSWRRTWRLSPATRAAIFDVVATFAAIKCGFYLLALLATWMLPEYAGDGYPRWYSGADRLIDVSWRWDGEWYMSIAREGYALRDGYTNVAFFPLYPLLTKLLGLVLGGEQLPLAGVLVASAAFLAALGYLHALATLDGGPALARRAIWYVAIVPSAFFFIRLFRHLDFSLFRVARILVIAGFFYKVISIGHGILIRLILFFRGWIIRHLKSDFARINFLWHLAHPFFTLEFRPPGGVVK